MAVKITGIEPGSPAKRTRIKPGDTLISINGNAITDVLDYRFYMTDERLELLLCDQDKKVYRAKVKKEEYDDLGLEFETYLMDRQMGCKNKCAFCFVDQMPPGMRKSLYFKDDDTRMSFLFGNYTTLTNLKESDIRRVIKMHISPINVSVHTTNPELRVKMMGNPFAGEALKFIKLMTDHGIRVNSQIVLCPGLNDGPELERSLSDLGKLLPNLQSIAVVPVGLTKYRENLPALRGCTKEEAGQVIDILERWGDRFLKEFGARTAYASDEFYLTAGRPFPESSFYEDFAQLENGVGMIPLLRQEFEDALDDPDLPESSQVTGKITMATGVLAYPTLAEFAQRVMERYPNREIQVKRIVNDFFGESITVAGLVTGQDLIRQLEGSALGSSLLIPANMLRHEQDRFLDDVTLEEVRQRLDVSICPVENDGYALLERMLS